MSTTSLDQGSMPPEKRNHLKTTDRGMPFKKMAKILSKRLMKAKDQEFPLELVDQAWFHGRMTSEYAVKVLHQEGEFLVRENPSRPGDYAFSVNQNGVVKHFPIERSTTKNLKYKYKIYKSGSFENLVGLVDFLYSNKKLVTVRESVVLGMPANRDTGLLLVPDLAGHNRVAASAPVSPAGTPPLLRRGRNSSDPLLNPSALKSLSNHFEKFTPRERSYSRSSPPSLYVEDVDNNGSEGIYDEITVPARQQEDTQSAVMKKKQSILNDVFQMFRNCLFKEFEKHDCLTLAKHMTRRDLEVVWGEGFADQTKEEKLNDTPSGLELILFPQGKELRQTILRRFSTITIWVASMIISVGDVDDRVEMMKIFIGVAHALYSCLGNLNGFMAVMEGLELAQVNRLKESWQRLEDVHPKLAIVYHNKLKSLYAILNSHGSHPSLGNVKPCLPYIAHVVKCLEFEPNRIGEIGNGVEELDELEVMLHHLRTARDYGNKVDSYRRQAVGFVKNMKEEAELDEYCTNTVCVAKSVGLGFNEPEVMTKMSALLVLMSQHIEPNS